MRALYDWQLKRLELIRALRDHGTNATKAAELGISETNLSTLLYRARNQFEYEYKRPAGVYEALRRENIERTRKANELKETVS